MNLPKQPVLYEINTIVWLHDLSQRYGERITLATVPDAEWDALAALHVGVVWLMGVWERSPAGRALALNDTKLMQELRSVLPDFTPDYVVSSPYCVRAYVVDEALGGRAELAIARAALAARGIALMLDFVPNHTAPDHPWTLTHPEYYIQGTAEDYALDPSLYLLVGDKVLACGRDPFSPPWTDVVQLNVFAPGLRAMMTTTLLDIASQCDGVRCDMAMLAINGIFGSFWKERAGAIPENEYWTQVIGGVKSMYPHFLWMAEAYWDTEAALHQLGFDYCYDKRFYDHIVKEDAGAMHTLLAADPAFQQRLVRFIENHDEPRAASHFRRGQALMAAVATATQPGMRFFHEGQFEGRKRRAPLFLDRRPSEEVDEEVRAFYTRLLALLHTEPLQTGTWRLCEVMPMAHFGGAPELVAWCWQSNDEPQQVALIVVNPTHRRVEARASVPIARTPAEELPLRASLSDQPSADEYLLTATGIAFDLAPYGYRLLLSGTQAQ